MKLSIIIPVYNVEQYIEKCLLSCINQDIPNSDYEIIVVNDGSPDGSLAIAERIAERVHNIRIISQTNGGLSAARNKGLSLAKGEYIWFIDSDDWIEENCLSRLLLLCKDIDLVGISYNIVKNNIKTKYTPQFARSGKELLLKGAIDCAPFYIIRNDFLKSNNLLFLQGIYHEDAEFTPRMLYLADRIIFHKEPIYNYLQRESSITTTPNVKRAFDYIKVAQSLYVFKTQNVRKEECFVFDNKISLCLNNALAIISTKDKQEQYLWRKYCLQNKELFNSLLKSSIWKYKIEGLLFATIPFLDIIKLYRFMQLFNYRKSSL